MSPSSNTRSRSKTYKETLGIVPTTSPTSPSISKSDVYNIYNDIKTMTDKHHSDIETRNYHISSMLTKLTDTNSKTENQEEQLTDISSKLSNYEDCLDKLSIKKHRSSPCNSRS